MLFEIKNNTQVISLVLNKIIGVTNCGGNHHSIKCHIFTIGDEEGFNCTEPYRQVCARLISALESINKGVDG